MPMDASANEPVDVDSVVVAVVPELQEITLKAAAVINPAARQQLIIREKFRFIKTSPF
jgi:hypothetical protein